MSFAGRILLLLCSYLFVVSTFSARVRQVENSEEGEQVIDSKWSNFNSLSDFSVQNARKSSKNPGALLLLSKDGRTTRSSLVVKNKIPLTDTLVYESRFFVRPYDCGTQCDGTVGVFLQDVKADYLNAAPAHALCPAPEGLIFNGLSLTSGSQTLTGGACGANGPIEAFNTEVFNDRFPQDKTLEVAVTLSSGRIAYQVRRHDSNDFSFPTTAVISNIRKTLKSNRAYFGLWASTPKAAGNLDVMNMTLRSFDANSARDVDEPFDTLAGWNAFGDIPTDAKNSVPILHPKSDASSLWYKTPFRLSFRHFYTVHLSFTQSGPTDLVTGTGFAFVINPLSALSPPGSQRGYYGACPTNVQSNGRALPGANGGLVFVGYNMEKRVFEVGTCQGIKTTIPTNIRADSTVKVNVRIAVEPQRIRVSFRQQSLTGSNHPAFSNYVDYNFDTQRNLDRANIAYFGLTANALGNESKRPTLRIESMKINVQENLCVTEDGTDPCNKRGECSTENGKAACKCVTGFIGNDCSLEDPQVYTSQIEKLQGEINNMKLAMAASRDEINTKITTINVEKGKKLTAVDAALKQALQNAKIEADQVFMTAQEVENKKMEELRVKFQEEMKALEEQTRAALKQAEANKERAIAKLDADLVAQRQQLEEMKKQAEERKARLAQQAQQVAESIMPMQEKYEKKVETEEVSADQREGRLRQTIREAEARLTAELDRANVERQKLEDEINRRRSEIEARAFDIIKRVKEDVREQTAKIQLAGEQAIAVAKSSADRAQQQKIAQESELKALQREKARIEQATKEAEKLKATFEAESTRRVAELERKLAAQSTLLDAQKHQAEMQLGQLEAQTAAQIAAIRSTEQEAEQSALKHEHELENERDETDSEIQRQEARMQMLSDETARQEARVREDTRELEERIRNEAEDRANELRAQIKAADAAAEATLQMARAATEQAAAATMAAQKIAIDQIMNPSPKPTQDPHLVPLLSKYAVIPAETLVKVRLASAVGSESAMLAASKKIFAPVAAEHAAAAAAQPAASS